MTICPVCDCEIRLDENVIVGEVIDCYDCGSDLEVIGLNPNRLDEAPETDEDWGE